MNPRTKSQDIRDLSQNDIRELVAELGQPAFRAKQLIEWVFEKNVCSFDDMTNLPKAFREQLKEAFAFDTPTELTKQVSKDGSRKYLLEYHDGISVETVGMPRRNKLSVCVSTQAGCGMGCAFCATGLNGLKRSLTAQEIVDQVLHVSNDFGERATSVVFMGQGEPFANYDEVLKALRILNDPDGIGIGARHLTVSTSGVIPGIRKFADIPEQFTLAVSLHSAIQSTRNKLMPGVKKYTRSLFKRLRRCRPRRLRCLSGRKQWSKIFCRSYGKALRNNLLCKSNSSILIGNCKNRTCVTSSKFTLKNHLLNYFGEIEKAQRVCNCRT